MTSSRSVIGFLAVIALCTVGGCDLLSSPRERAEKLLASGDLPAALTEATHAVADEPDDARAHLLLARIAIAQGDPAMADRALTKAGTLGADPARIAAERARALIGAGDYAAIIETIHSDPAYPAQVRARIHVARGLAHLARDEPEEASRALQAALAAVPDYADALLLQARIANRASDPDQALALTERVIAQDPHHADAWAFKAALLQDRRRIEEAILAYQQAATQDPGNIAHDLSAANLLMRTERFEPAQRHIAQARKRAPNALAPHYAQVLLHFRRKHYDQALEVAQAILKRQPENEPALLFVALARFERGELNQVESLLRPLVRANAESAFARKLLARAQMRADNLTGALESLAPFERAASPDYEALTLLGEIHVRARSYDKAAVYYERAAQLQLQRPEALAGAGVAELSSGDAETGLAMLEQAAALGRSNGAADITLSLLLLQQGEFRRALDVALRLEKNQPDSPLVHAFAALALTGLKDTAGARTHFEQALTIAPAFWLAAANLARLDLAAGNAEAARDRIEQAIASDPQSIETITALWRITGDRGKFVELLEAARKADPDALSPRLALARAYVDLELGTRAVAVAREAAAIAPSRPESLEVLGLAQMAAGLPAEALTTFRDLATLAPQSARVHVHRARALLALDDVTGAEAAYGKALSLDPGDPEALLGRARLHARTGRFEQALQTANELEQRYPRSAIGHELAGDILMQHERYPEAVDAFAEAHARQPSGALVIKRHAAASMAGMKPSTRPLEHWLAQHPNDHEVRFYLATRRHLAGRLDEAIGGYRRILQSDPMHVLALSSLAATYLEVDDAQALPTAEAAYRLKPDDPSVLDTYGKAQLRFGKADRALDLLGKALARNPDSAATQVNYALALAKTGERTRARTMLQNALKADKSLVLGKEAEALLHAN